MDEEFEYQVFYLFGKLTKDLCQHCRMYKDRGRCNGVKVGENMLILVDDATYHKMKLDGWLPGKCNGFDHMAGVWCHPDSMLESLEARAGWDMIPVPLTSLMAILSKTSDSINRQALVEFMDQAKKREDVNDAPLCRSV